MRYRQLAFAAALTLLAAPSALRAEDGTSLFLALACNKCHAIERHQVEATTTSDRMKGPDLGTTGDRHDTDWIARFLRREVDRNGAKHKVAWKGSDQQLAQIAGWLAAQKSQ